MKRHKKDKAKKKKWEKNTKSVEILPPSEAMGCHVLWRLSDGFSDGFWWRNREYRAPRDQINPAPHTHRIRIKLETGY